LEIRLEVKYGCVDCKYFYEITHLVVLPPQDIVVDPHPFIDGSMMAAAALVGYSQFNC
jgi:hypothetical protein